MHLFKKKNNILFKIKTASTILKGKVKKRL